MPFRLAIFALFTSFVSHLLAADLFDKSNLVAWCIVPFDKAKRTPEARAEMVAKMGIKKIAYDWRAEHVAEFEREILAYQKHGIEMFAFWGVHDEAFRLFEKYKLHPQLWVMLKVAGDTDEAKIKAAAEALLPTLERAKKLGSQVGLYNHGGWGGEPENMIAVCEFLKKHHGTDNIGIVYNLHHGHSHLDRLPKVLAAMKPWLLCLNLNGMDIAGDTKGRKILPLGVGTQDVTVLRQIRASGYGGPIGILNHTNEDAEARLLDNLDGLAWLVPQLDDAKPGAKPQYRSWSTPTAAMPVAPLSPAPFTPSREPLDKSQNIHWQEFVNRDRVYDFYAKQALHFMKQKPLPELLPQFPGLDGGKIGHWGNQNDKVTWKDGRWAASDLGSVFSCVFKGAGLTIPKAVCVREGGTSYVFDTAMISRRATWTGGFVKLTDHRHGFMGGAAMDGKVVKMDPEETFDGAVKYLGFYRHGKKVIFSTSNEGRRSIDTPESAPYVKGGPAQWPQWIETKGTLGTQQPFATDTIELPFKNPYGTLFFITAHDFFSDGTAAIATMTGEVWLVKGIDEKLQKIRWKRFATGLHQPLGMKIVKDRLYVLGRDQITCLHDLNGDDEADFYECVTNAMQTSPGGHDFIVGLETDKEGRWYFASGNQGVCRIGTDGYDEKLEVLGTGFRNPNGLGISSDGKFITTSGQEGDWTPATSIFQIELDQNLGAHFGAGGPKDGKPPEPVLLYLPRGEDNSASSQAFITSEKWAVLKGDGNLIHLSSGSGSAWLVMRQNVKGRWQAAAVKICGNFDSGPQCARFNPKDGHLYVNGMTGWGTYTPKDGSFQRVRFTGGDQPVPVGFEARDNGVLLRFNQPVKNTDAATCFAQCWNYKYGPQYGSPEYSVRHADTPGHDPLEVRSVQTLDGGKTLFLEIPQIVPAGQIHLHLSTGHDVFLTAHALAEPFTEFAGYTKIAKTNHAAQIGLEAPKPAKPNPWAKGEPGREIVVEAALGLQFVQKQLTAKAGEKLTLRFKNPDVVPHNWLLAKPGSLQKLGEKVNLMITDPQGMAKHYVPDSDDVIAYTDMTNPKAEFVIHLTAPKEKGDYPYLCTFPGHWMVMNGVMKVE